MRSSSRALALIVTLVAVMLLWWRPSGPEPPQSSPQVLALGGVRRGDSQEKVRQVLGTPTRLEPDSHMTAKGVLAQGPPQMVYQLPEGETRVTLGDDRVAAISTCSLPLTAGAECLPGVGASLAELRGRWPALESGATGTEVYRAGAGQAVTFHLRSEVVWMVVLTGSEESQERQLKVR